MEKQFLIDDLKLTEPDKTKLSEIFTELGFNRLLTQLGLSAATGAKPATATASAAVDLEQRNDISPVDGPASVKNIEHNYQLLSQTCRFWLSFHQSLLSPLYQKELFDIPFLLSHVDLFYSRRRPFAQEHYCSLA